MTDEIEKRRKIEGERDVDLLTQLYNRRGLEMKLSAISRDAEKSSDSMLVMIDADDLKFINDTYGHEAGDIYLQEIATRLQKFAADRGVAARLGGDEFVLYLYRFAGKTEMAEVIRALESMQEGSPVALAGNISVSVRFSFGYSLAEGNKDYQAMLKEADEKMYENKRERKRAADIEPAAARQI